MIKKKKLANQRDKVSLNMDFKQHMDNAINPWSACGKDRLQE